MSFNRGDVVLVPFPFTDLTTQKQRPALVISSNDFNSSSLDVILLGITSQIPRAVAQSDCYLTSDEQQRAGLPKPSIVKAAKVVTLSQSLIRKAIGRLPVQTVDQVVTKLEAIIKWSFRLWNGNPQDVVVGGVAELKANTEASCL